MVDDIRRNFRGDRHSQPPLADVDQQRLDRFRIALEGYRQRGSQGVPDELPPVDQFERLEIRDKPKDPLRLLFWENLERPGEEDHPGAVGRREIPLGRASGGNGMPAEGREIEGILLNALQGEGAGQSPLLDKNVSGIRIENL